MKFKFDDDVTVKINPWDGTEEEDAIKTAKPLAKEFKCAFHLQFFGIQRYSMLNNPVHYLTITVLPDGHVWRH